MNQIEMKGVRCSDVAGLFSFTEIIRKLKITLLLVL